MCMFTSAFNGFLMYYTQTRIYEVLSPYTTPLPTVLPLAPWLSLCCSNMPSSTSSRKAFTLAFSSAWNTLSYIPKVPTVFCLLQKKKMFHEDPLCSWHCQRHQGTTVNKTDKSLLLCSICPSSWHLLSLGGLSWSLIKMLMSFIFSFSYFFCLFPLVYLFFERRDFVSLVHPCIPRAGNDV